MTDHGNNGVAADLLRSYFERWKRLEDEKQTISDDLKDLFKEAKGNGFDAKAMRSVFRDKSKEDAEAEKPGAVAERQEFEAVCDLYRAALDGLDAPRAMRATRVATDVPIDHPDPKLIATIANGIQTETGRKALVTALDAMIEAEERVDPKTGEIITESGGGAVAEVTAQSQLADAVSIEPPPPVRAKVDPYHGMPLAVDGKPVGEPVPDFLRRDGGA